MTALSPELRICRLYGLPDDHIDLLTGSEFEMRQQAREMAEIWAMPMRQLFGLLRDPDSELRQAFFGAEAQAVFRQQRQGES